MIYDFSFVFFGSSFSSRVDLVVGILLLLPIACMLMLVGPTVCHRSYPRCATIAMLLNMVLSLGLLWTSARHIPIYDSWFSFDRLTAVMLVLVTGVSGIVHAFSLRYIDVDRRYTTFFRSLNFLTVAVLTVVCTNNIVALVLGWSAVSIGLYLLQRHYRERPQATLAANRMYRVHFLGDLSLGVAAFLLVAANGTTHLSALLRHGEHLHAIELTLIASLIGIAVCTKSAQVPFHAWLPETMEAPTPVSALMHAGVVNAGGFLLARTAGILTHAPSVATILFSLGATSALWGTACMLVRSEVKRKLAYSTMGQMGYMVMQCGLGAFPAAILHLCAHGLLKASLFLGSGSHIRRQRESISRLTTVDTTGGTQWARSGSVLFAALFGVGTAYVVQQIFSEPYLWVLILFATMTLMQMCHTLVQKGSMQEHVLAMVMTMILLPTYAIVVHLFDRFLQPSMVASGLLVPASYLVVVIGIFFCAMLAMWRVIRIPFTWRDRIYMWLLQSSMFFGVSR